MDSVPGLRNAWLRVVEYLRFELRLKASRGRRLAEMTWQSPSGKARSRLVQLLPLETICDACRTIDNHTCHACGGRREGGSKYKVRGSQNP